MSEKKDEYEARYSAYVQFACLGTLLAVVAIDAFTGSDYKEVELALVAAFGGLFSKEKLKEIKRRK